MQYWIHHLNDLSGSPLILSEQMRKIAVQSEVILVTNQSTGFLSNWEGKKVIIPYTKYSNKFIRYFSISIWYTRALLFLLIYLRPGDQLMLSTLISSPLLIARFFRPNISATLIVNEVFFRVPVWRSIGLILAQSISVKKIYLSKFVRRNWGFFGASEIQYPPLRKELVKLSNSLDNSKYKDREKLNFFSVGTYIESKGYQLFIDVAAYFHLHNKKHTFHLYLSGSEDRFKAEFQRTSLPPNLVVTFNNHSPEIYLGHDIFLGLTNPKLWIETFGQTFAEAMMTGNIVVVPPVGGHLEYIKDGYSGFLFEEYSVRGICSQVNRVLEKENLEELGAQARLSIREFYNTCHIEI